MGASPQDASSAAVASLLGGDRGWGRIAGAKKVRSRISQLNVTNLRDSRFEIRNSKFETRVPCLTAQNSRRKAYFARRRKRRARARRVERRGASVRKKRKQSASAKQKKKSKKRKHDELDEDVPEQKTKPEAQPVERSSKTSSTAAPIADTATEERKKSKRRKKSKATTGDADTNPDGNKATDASNGEVQPEAGAEESATDTTASAKSQRFICFIGGSPTFIGFTLRHYR